MNLRIRLELRSGRLCHMALAMLVVIAPSLLSGCRLRSDPSVDLLESELRWMEDQLYLLDDELEIKCQQLASSHRENATLRQELHQALARTHNPTSPSANPETGNQSANRPHSLSTPRRSNSPSANPNRGGSGPNSPSQRAVPPVNVPRDNLPQDNAPPGTAPATPPPQTAPSETHEPDLLPPEDELRPPEVELGVPVKPASSIEPASGIEPALTSPAGGGTDWDVAFGSGSRFWNNRTARLARETSPVVDPHVVSIELNSRLTGGYDFDGRPGHEGLLAVIEPRNNAGQYVPLPGKLSIVVIDPVLAGPAGRLARWDFQAHETASHLRTSLLGQGIHLQLPWPHHPPQNDQLQVHVRYYTADGRKLQTHRTIWVEPQVQRTPTEPLQLSPEMAIPPTFAPSQATSTTPPLLPAVTEESSHPLLVLPRFTSQPSSWQPHR